MEFKAKETQQKPSFKELFLGITNKKALVITEKELKDYEVYNLKSSQAMYLDCGNKVYDIRGCVKALQKIVDIVQSNKNNTENQRKFKIHLVSKVCLWSAVYEVAAVEVEEERTAYHQHASSIAQQVVNGTINVIAAVLFLNLHIAGLFTLVLGFDPITSIAIFMGLNASAAKRQITNYKNINMAIKQIQKTPLNA